MLLLLLLKLRPSKEHGLRVSTDKLLLRLGCRHHLGGADHEGWRHHGVCVGTIHVAAREHGTGRGVRWHRQYHHRLLLLQLLQLLLLWLLLLLITTTECISHTREEPWREGHGSTGVRWETLRYHPVSRGTHESESTVAHHDGLHGWRTLLLERTRLLHDLVTQSIVHQGGTLLFAMGGGMNES